MQLDAERRLKEYSYGTEQYQAFGSQIDRLTFTTPAPAVALKLADLDVVTVLALGARNFLTNRRVVLALRLIQ